MKHIAIIALALMAVVILTISFSYQKKPSDICMTNIAALTQTEEPVTDYWCCGTTSTCMEHAQFKILGKLQTKPCE